MGKRKRRQPKSNSSHSPSPLELLELPKNELTIQELHHIRDIMDAEDDIFKALTIVFGPDTPVRYILERFRNSVKNL